MGLRQPILQRLTDAINLPEEPIPGSSTLELLGSDRVLIERHRGILEYSAGRILTAVSFGRLLILGERLILKQMTQDKVIITGRILSISIERGASQ